MEGFEKYTDETEEFRRSELFQKKYKRFVSILVGDKRKFKSFELEKILETSGASIRALVKHARREGVLLCSNESGYWVGTPDEIQETIRHMSERSNSMLFTCSMLNESVEKNHPNFIAKKK